MLTSGSLARRGGVLIGTIRVIRRAKRAVERSDAARLIVDGTAERIGDHDPRSGNPQMQH
jgi:hypothetical protein